MAHLTLVDSLLSASEHYTVATDPDLHSQVLNLPTSCHSTLSYHYRRAEHVLPVSTLCHSQHGGSALTVST